MKIIPVFLSALFLIGGCHHNTFNSKVEEGKESLIEEEYKKALVSFESASEENIVNEEVNVLIDQTEKMIDAVTQQERGNTYEAIGLFEQVRIMDDGYDILSQQAKERKEILQHKEQDKYKEQLIQAEELKNNKKYDEAKKLLTGIIYGTDVFKFLDEQHEKAKELLTEIDSEVSNS